MKASQRLHSGRQARHRWTVVLAAMVLVVAACGDDDTTTPAGDTSTTAASAESGSTTTTEPGETATGVQLYFAWDEEVGTAGRPDVTGGPEAAVEALLGGPDDFESEIGMTTAIPEGATLLGVTVEEGTAVVDLSEEFGSGGGSLSMELRVAQVVFTLTQFDKVETVTVHLGGEAVEAIGGEGVPAADLDRGDFENVTPAILVESPVPGMTVTSPLTVTGVADTPDATLQYAITDGDGRIVAEGSTTATAGSGPLAEFSFTEEFEVERAGLGAIIVWQEDPETGEQRDVYEVPIRVS